MKNLACASGGRCRRRHALLNDQLVPHPCTTGDTGCVLSSAVVRSAGAWAGCCEVT